MAAGLESSRVGGPAHLTMSTCIAIIKVATGWLPYWCLAHRAQSPGPRRGWRRECLARTGPVFRWLDQRMDAVGERSIRGWTLAVNLLDQGMDASGGRARRGNGR
jgi:hypothetical protein